MNSISVSENALGFTAVRLHYSADPAKDPTTPEGQKWFTQARQTYPDPNQWAQEMEINWWVAAGTRVFPEFTESMHGIVLDGFRDRKVIYRAWDFGWHAPACLIAQIDSKDRLIVLKEIIGHENTTREFAENVIAKCAELFPYHNAGFQDFCDPAGQQVSSKANERSEVRDVEILNKLGIFPSWEYGWSRKDGRSLIHQLLVPRLDGTPSLYVNTAQCPVLLQAFLGKYVYPPKKGGIAADEPDENNHPWADAMASLRYLCTGLYSALGLRRFAYQPVMQPQPTHHGYGSPIRSSWRSEV